MTEPTEAEIEAGATEIEVESLRFGFLRPEVCRAYSRAALTAAAQVREDYRRRNCKHPRMKSSGMLSSDGSSYSKWSCPDCLASGAISTPPGPAKQATQINNAALMPIYSATEDQG